ncbi:MAG: sigma-70 family RNA polymerase sigma factor [Balneolaceae bacterium]
MSSELPTDIWDRFVSGDCTCFKKLFEEYYKGLYGYGLKLCSNSELVEDSIQDIFVSVWERKDELTHVISPNVYLYVSLRRRIFKMLKKNNKLKSMPGEGEEGFSICFGVEEIIIKKEYQEQQKETLKLAFEQLSNQQKEVLFLHYYNGMSYGEIEDILSINRQSVRNHVYRAMQTLRSILNKDVMRLVNSLVIFFLLSSLLIYLGI